MDTLPEDRATLPKFNSDVCKWHLFISNITEDVFHVLQETFNLDYTRQLKFQVHSEQQELQSSHCNVICLPASATDDTLKGSFHSSIVPLLINLWSTFYLLISFVVKVLITKLMPSQKAIQFVRFLQGLFSWTSTIFTRNSRSSFWFAFKSITLQRKTSNQMSHSSWSWV